MGYLACDLGAESGRLMFGEISGRRIDLREIHRFPNTPVREGSSLHWNIGQLFDELKAGLTKAAAAGLSAKSLSTDSWGLDYVLFDQTGQRIDPVFHYRDPRCDAGVKRVEAVVSRAEVFGETGIQFMPMNTIYQLMAEEPARLDRSHQLLLIADAFNFLLSGIARAEESLASTTQLYSPVKRGWSDRLLAALKLPKPLLPAIVPCGTPLGPVTAAIRRETGLPPCEIIASCSHDTAAAVVAVPGQGTDWAYISSGTWSLLGVEAPSSFLTERCRELNFTNEVGFSGTIRLLKNIVGLWIVQECRRHWAASGQNLDYDRLTAMAAEAPPFRSLIRPDDTRFLTPDGMPQKIATYCRETGQPEPRTAGETVRCALESLALLYRRTLRQLETLLARPIRVLHIVGGGSRNALLNQFAANAVQIPVLAGPIEATTLGNILVQAMAVGNLKSLDESRALVRESVAIQQFQPKDATQWDEAAKQFEQLEVH